MGQATDRRTFLRRAGVGSLVLASFPALAETASGAEAVYGKPITFRFVSNSNAAVVGGVAHRMLMNGEGRVTHNNVVGGGAYVHINNAPSLPTPKPILTAGTWKAKRLTRLHLIGAYGVLAAGIVELDIELHQTSPSSAVIPATFEMVCNLAPAGLINDGEEEGFTLTIAGVDFGPFKPTTPASGLTVYALA